jgi:hypothetical protein
MNPFFLSSFIVTLHRLHLCETNLHMIDSSNVNLHEMDIIDVNLHEIELQCLQIMLISIRIFLKLQLGLPSDAHFLTIISENGDSNALGFFYRTCRVDRMFLALITVPGPG